MEAGQAAVKKVSIIGVGLLGGSLAKAIKSEYEVEVIGIGRNQEALQECVSKGILSRYTLDYKEGVQDSDIVIIATPVQTIVPIYKKILPYLNSNVVVTDVGSTKVEMLNEISKMGKKAKELFIGSHPMAGGEQEGYKYSNEELYKGSVILVIKEKHTNSTKLKQIKSLWEKVGGNVCILDKEEHDKIVSLTSHLPHIISSCLSFTLLHSLAFEKGIKEGIFGKGLLDTTRISMGEVTMWNDIIKTNRENILEGIKVFKDSIEVLKGLIERMEEDKLKIYLSMGRGWRKGIEIFGQQQESEENSC